MPRNIPCNILDESQVIISGAKEVHDLLDMFYRTHWDKYVNDGKPTPSFWEYLESTFNCEMDTAGSPWIIVIQFKTKQEAFKFKLVNL